MNKVVITEEDIKYIRSEVEEARSTNIRGAVEKTKHRLAQELGISYHTVHNKLYKDPEEQKEYQRKSAQRKKERLQAGLKEDKAIRENPQLKPTKRVKPKFWDRILAVFNSERVKK